MAILFIIISYVWLDDYEFAIIEDGVEIMIFDEGNLHMNKMIWIC